MIQRKQSLWLFLAAVLNAGVLFFDLYRMHTSTHSMVNGADTVVDTAGQLRVSDHFPSLIIALIMAALPFIAIFLFQNRKRQTNLTLFSILATAAFIAISLVRVNNLSKLMPAPNNGSYWIGAILPVIALVFLFLALGGIRKDEKLVRSMDRLR